MAGAERPAENRCRLAPQQHGLSIVSALVSFGAIAFGILWPSWFVGMMGI